MKNPVCDTCDRTFGYKRHGTRMTCGSCYNGRHRFAFKSACIAYKGGECQLCGYKKCQRALSFHHIDRATKTFSIGAQIGFSRSRAKVKAELDKCVLLCKNCHEEVEDALKWRPDDAILLKLAMVATIRHASEFVFSRGDWKQHHPKFAN